MVRRDTVGFCSAFRHFGPSSNTVSARRFPAHNAFGLVLWSSSVLDRLSSAQVIWALPLELAAVRLAFRRCGSTGVRLVGSPTEWLKSVCSDGSPFGDSLP